MKHEEGPILPLLKPADWENRAMSVHRPLVPDQEAEYMPVVSFGYDQPHSFRFLTLEEIPAAGEPDQLEMIEQAALRNLRRRSVSWEIESIDLGGGQQLRMALCTDDFLAAERILDAEFMREAHGLLKAEMLAVGLPRRGILVATEAKQPEALVSRFGGFVSMQYFRAESAPISPIVFVVVEGQVVGMVKGMEESGKGIIEEERESEADIQCSGMVVRHEETGRQRIEVIAGGEDLESLARVIQNGIVQMVQSLEEEAEFDGHVRVILNPALTPRTKESDREFASLEAHLNGVVRDLNLSTKRGEPVHVRLIYGGD